MFIPTLNSITTAQLQALILEDRSIRGLLEARVDEHGKRPLLRWRGRDYTYKEIDELANAVANSLLRLGIAFGDRVAIMMTNSPEWIAFWLGATKIGAVTVTINTAQKGVGLAYILRDSGPKLLAIDADFVPRLTTLDDVELPPTFVTSSTGTDTISPARPFAELLAGEPSRPPQAELELRTPCSILYTSGTTGPAKGCLLPHGQYLAAAYLHSASCEYGQDTTVYACLPLFHIAAQNYAFLSVLSAGGTLALDDRFTASGFWDRITDARATAFNLVGSMAVALWNQEPKAVERTHTARLAFGCPVPIPIWEEWEKRFNCKIVYAYGMTENAIPALMSTNDAPVPPRLRGAAGRASLTTEIAIVGDDDLPVPAGTLGELVTRPTIPWTMMLEYVNRPTQTAEAFQNCWFHTGDIGYLDDAGYFFYVDRRKDALRRRGEMVSSWEVEETISKSPTVVDCAVVGVPSELGEDEILAVVVPEHGFHPAELITFCEERMAKHQIPRYIRAVTELPRTQTQRIEKFRASRRRHHRWTHGTRQPQQSGVLGSKPDGIRTCLCGTLVESTCGLRIRSH